VLVTELQLGSRLLIAVIVIGLIGGLAIGLWIGWIAWPVQVTNVDVADLNSPSQEEYIVLTASDYAFDQNLDRAKQRLAQLHDPRINDRLAALAKEYAQAGKTYAPYVAALAVALGSTDSQVALIATTATPTITNTPTPTATSTPTLTPVPTETNAPTPTFTRTPITPRPTTRPRSTATPKPAPVAGTNWIPPYPAEWPGDVKFTPASAAPGQKYWHLIKALYCDTNDTRNDCPNLPGGGIGTGIYVALIDSSGARASGVPLLVTKPDGKQDFLEEKSAGDMCDCNYAFEANGFPIQVGGAPSDTISGLALYSVKAGLGNYHVRYFLTFQLVTR
jgi:hypothetical protein